MLVEHFSDIMAYYHVRELENAMVSCEAFDVQMIIDWNRKRIYDIIYAWLACGELSFNANDRVSDIT